ncbi:response regulator [Pseudomonas putida]|uniref:Transcriptional regulator n=1 Tax=Pseudomonas putida TaxID=303 RepID=A0A1Q9QZF5_PSEPU|nr:response regulator [Pseudomonas putida]OLS60514.1 putative transcriptional regulator [Pseudomonas putida]
MARILIADEHPFTRHALRGLLENERHVIAGEATDGLEALSMAANLNPDLLIIDLDLSRITGLDVISRLRARGSLIPILGFSTQDSEHFVGRFLRAGASGFVSKHQDSPILSEAVGVLLRGQTYFPSSMLGTVNRHSVQEDDAKRVASLSNRELSVLTLLATGYDNHEIASELTISEKSVSTYRARIRAKLGVYSLLDLVDFARRNRLAESASQMAPPAIETLAVTDMWRSMVESLPGAFYVRDTQARLLYANPAHLRMYRADLEQVQGTKTTEVDWYNPADAKNMLVFLQRAISERRSFDKDIELTIHGQRRVLHHWGTPYLDPEGNMLGMICCSTDVTHRYEQLDALRAKSQASELDTQRLTELLVSLGESMEAGLTTLSQTLLDGQGDSSSLAREQISELQEKLKTVMIAATPSKEPSSKLEAVNLAGFVRQALMRSPRKAANKGVITRIDSDLLSDNLVLVDTGMLGQLLHHLASYLSEVISDGELHCSLYCTTKQNSFGARLTFRSVSVKSEPLRSYSLSELNASSEARSDDRAPLELIIARQLAARQGMEINISHHNPCEFVAHLHMLLERPIN